MIILLDTSTSVVSLKIVDGDQTLLEDTWDANHELAEKLLGYLERNLSDLAKEWTDLSGIGLFKGPGSFTGLRIGASVCNTLASTLRIPIVGVSGDDWREKAQSRLSSAEDDTIVLPDYGRPARITAPRK